MIILGYYRFNSRNDRFSAGILIAFLKDFWFGNSFKYTQGFSLKNANFDFSQILMDNIKLSLHRKHKLSLATLATQCTWGWPSSAAVISFPQISRYLHTQTCGFIAGLDYHIGLLLKNSNKFVPHSNKKLNMVFFKNAHYMHHASKQTLESCYPAQRLIKQ